jgi:hypothetical protein
MDSQFTSGLFSPYIVPVAGTIMVLGIVAVSKWSEYNTRRLQYEERMAALTKGLPIPELPMPVKEVRKINLQVRMANVRRGGIVLVAGSLGVAGFFFLLFLVIGQHEILAGAAAAFVPFGIGVGLLIDAHMQEREIKSESLTSDTYPS